MLGITIRINGATDTVTTDDGAVFDRSTMTKAERNKLTRLVRGVYEQHLQQGQNG